MIALHRLAEANPVPHYQVDALVPEGWSDELLTRVFDTPIEPRRDGRRPRMLLVIAAALALLAAPSYAIARGLLGWLGAEPAPPAVVADFDSYARQLGFDPVPGKAVLVAEDGDFALYATTNRQGGYCLVTSAPWKRPDKLPDGGSCVSAEEAAEPLRAMLGGASAARREGDRRLSTFVIVGRAADPRAGMVRLTRADGLQLDRQVGVGGFFVVGVEREVLCPGQGESIEVRALAPDGEELARTTVGDFRCVTPR